MVVDSPAAAADEGCGFLVRPVAALGALPGVRARTRLTGVDDSATDSSDAICGFFLRTAAGLALLPAPEALFLAALACASGSTSGAERGFFAAGFLAAGFLTAGFLAAGFSAPVGFVPRERRRGESSTVEAAAASVTGSSAGTSPALSSCQAVIRLVTVANLPLVS